MIPYNACPQSDNKASQKRFILKDRTLKGKFDVKVANTLIRIGHFQSIMKV